MGTENKNNKLKNNNEKIRNNSVNGKALSVILGLFYLNVFKINIRLKNTLWCDLKLNQIHCGAVSTE